MVKLNGFSGYFTANRKIPMQKNHAKIEETHHSDFICSVFHFQAIRFVYAMAAKCIQQMKGNGGNDRAPTMFVFAYIGIEK